MPLNTAVAAEVQSVQVAIGGHLYLIDPAGYRRESIPTTRQQADTSFEPGEQSLNPTGLWRRSQDSWHHGAGNVFLDGRKGLSAYTQTIADPERFHTSKGLDPWTKGQVSLLHPTLKVWSTTNTNLYLAVAAPVGGLGFALYVSDGNELYWAALPYGGINSLALQNGTGWSATNATIGATGTTFQLTATSAAAVSVTSPTGTAGVPVDPGRQYGVNVTSVYVSGGATKTPQVNVTWYTAAGATISSTAPGSVPAAGTDTGPDGSVAAAAVTAPPTAAFVSVTLSYTANWANGEIHKLRGVNIGPYDDIVFTTAPDNWQSAGIQGGQPAQPVQSITTDGSYVWAALGTSGLHRTPAGGTALATPDVPPAIGAGQVSLVGYANGFLLAAGSNTSPTRQNVLWVVNDPLGSPGFSAIKTHPNDNFVWTFISPGRNCVYVGGNSGGNGEVYKILYDPNTGGLSPAASFATYLPDGETIHALQFYAGGIIMGTGKGVRLGQANGSGDIDYGPLIPTLWPVRCLEPQDRYCWFGWTKYDATSSGLGRVDLGFFTDTMTPAWAADLMTPDATQGDVVGAVTLAPYGYTANQRPPVRVFSVAGKGVYIEDPTAVVPSGQFETGSIRFSTSEVKQMRAVDVRHHALAGTVAAELKTDNGSYVSIGSNAVALSNGTTLSTAAVEGESAEIRWTLTRGTFSTGPELTRWTLKALPLPHNDELFTLPVLMKARTVTDQGDGADTPFDVTAETAFLIGLELSNTVFNLQIGGETFAATIEDKQFVGEHWSADRQSMEGVLTIRCRTIQ